jgi:hypothetical protein
MKSYTVMTTTMLAMVKYSDLRKGGFSRSKPNTKVIDPTSMTVDSLCVNVLKYANVRVESLMDICNGTVPTKSKAVVVTAKRNPAICVPPPR